MNKLFTKVFTGILPGALLAGTFLAIGLGGSKEPTKVEAATSTASVSISERAGTLGWSNGNPYSGWTDTSGIFTFTQTGGGNNGKYYTSDTTWRFYSGGKVGISCGSSYEILSVTSTPSTTFTIATDKHSASCAFSSSIRFKTFTISYQEASGTTYYGVTYDANGATSGTVPTDSTSYEGGDTVTVKENTGNLTKTGYTFEGWNTADDGTGVSYAAGTGTFTITANTTLYAEWDVDTLSSLSITGSMTKTQYKVNEAWNPAGFTVTANYQSGATVDVTNDAGLSWSYSTTTASTSTTTVTCTATFGGKSATSSAQSVTITEGATYDLTQISEFSSWQNSYTSHSVSYADIDSTLPAASMAFLITNRQGSGVGSTYPCIGAKVNSETQCLTFTLTEIGKKITSVDITFVTRYTKTFPTLYLHKGSGIASTALDTLTMSGAAGDEHTLSTSNLNDTIFTVGYNANQTGSNGAVGIKSISIGLANQEAFGTVDHITVTSFPQTVYHVGEVYDSTGLTVTAYDGADESTANFKDVTSSVSTGFTSGVYKFDDDDVPTTDMWVQYTEGGTTYEADDITMYVYALAEYELVTEAPADWSGNYLIVSTNYNDDLVAMNGGLSNPDVPDGYKVVTETSNVITAGQELEWTISAVTGGYSIQGKSGKYIGSLTSEKNGLLVSDSAVVNTLSYDNDATVITGANGYKLNIYNDTDTSRFRYYSSGSVQLYKLVESSEASDYADAFLLALQGGANPVCDVDGDTNLATLKTTWKSLADDFAGLSNADKEQFRLGVASESGNNIAQALALYDYVAAKYNTQLQGEGFVSNYDFMSRGITPLSNSKVILGGVIGENGSTTAIILIVSLVSIAAIGGYFFIRKRKEQ